MDPSQEPGKADNPDSELDLDYEELLEGGEETQVNPQVDPQGSGKDPLRREDPLEIRKDPIGGKHQVTIFDNSAIVYLPLLLPSPLPSPSPPQGEGKGRNGRI